MLREIWLPKIEAMTIICFRDIRDNILCRLWNENPAKKRYRFIEAPAAIIRKDILLHFLSTRSSIHVQTRSSTMSVNKFQIDYHFWKSKQFWRTKRKNNKWINVFYNFRQLSWPIMLKCCLCYYGDKISDNINDRTLAKFIQVLFCHQTWLKEFLVLKIIITKMMKK